MRNTVAAFGNKVFGGSVFNPINGSITGVGGTYEKKVEGQKINKSNNLINEIKNLQLENKPGCRFYVLKNVKTPENNFLDI